MQYLISISTGYLKHSLFENVDLAQCLSFNTVCKVNRYRGLVPSLNMNEIHLSVSLSVCLSLSHCPSFSLFLRLNISVSPSFSLSHSLSFCLSLFLSLKISVYSYGCGLPDNNILSLVLILDGSSGHGAHKWSKSGILICLRHFVTSKWVVKSEKTYFTSYVRNML